MTVARASLSSLNRGPSKKRTVLAGNDPILSGAYDSIATVNVGAGGQATITFSSIPSTYTHLQIRALTRSTSTPGSIDNYILRFNNDTVTNYASHRLDANGSIAYTQTAISYDHIINYISPNSTTLSNSFGVGIFDILDYANTNKFKTVRQLGGYELNGSGGVAFDSGLWRSTAAISTITFSLGSGNHAQYSQFALYGIR